MQIPSVLCHQERTNISDRTCPNRISLPVIRLIVLCFSIAEHGNDAGERVGVACVRIAGIRDLAYEQTRCKAERPTCRGIYPIPQICLLSTHIQQPVFGWRKMDGGRRTDVPEYGSRFCTTLSYPDSDAIPIEVS